MNTDRVNQELERLRSRVASLEEIQQNHERTVREQSTQLEKSLQELQQRAEQLQCSEDAMRRQTRILQAVLRSMNAGVVVAHETGKFLLFNPAAERILGIGASDASPEDWPRVYGCYLPDKVTPYPADQLPLSRAIRGEEVEETEVFIRNPNRPEGVWLSVNAMPLRDEVGAARGGVAVFRDSTEEKRGESHLAAQHAVTRVLAGSASLRDATPKILEAICESIGWDLGSLWILDQAANVLRCVDFWHRPGDFTEFEAVSRQRTFSRGIGLPGTVWARPEPTWIGEISEQANFPRAEAALAIGLCGAFAFPILCGNEVIGVIEFFSRKIRKPDEELLSMIGSLGSQIGQFIERKRAEEELRKSRERFELAMLGTGDGLWDMDPVTNEVYYSPRWKSMLGCAEHEIAQGFAEWEKRIHPDDHERALATYQAYLEGLTPTYELEHRLRHKDGSYRWILARGVALRDVNGKPYRIAGSHTDITERKQAEQALRDSEALYHSLVETLPLNVLRKDLEGKFTFGNKLFAKTVGRPIAEILGKTDFDFFPRPLAEKYRQDDRRVIEQEDRLDIVEEHLRPDGQKIYVQVLKTPVYDSKGEVVGIQGIFWDITDRVRAEAEMQKARDAAESANRAKSAFLANMSHEIRTPMNAIIGMTELVLDTEVGIEQREYLELVKKSADSLLSVINDVLDFSKVEAGKLDLDLVDFSLRDTLGDTLNTLAPRAHQKGLELVCHVTSDVPDGLQGDPLRLGQVVVNLVGNAIKFTESGEVLVDVATTAADEREAWLHIAVSDTGIGVPADKLDQIFDPFTQADGSTTRKYGGTGLGLAIAKRLIEIMGGRIWVESAVGKGSTFHFTARFAVQSQRIPRPAPVDVGTMRGMAVLIVDDNSTNRRILEETLSNWQMRPTLAESGAVALEIMRRAARTGEPFPLALIDVHMPEMDGYMLAGQIKREPELAGATLMVLTSSGQTGDSQRRRELGIRASLTKPIKQADLWKAIMQALGMPLPPDEAPPGPAGQRPRPVRRLRILLAEDNLVNQKLAARLLEKRGYQVTVVNNGREAIQAVRDCSFDVILMDVQMPELDGFEATAAIREQEKITGGHIPVVAMTAYAMKGDRERCLAGMDRYISKPIRAQELFENVEASVPAPGDAAVPLAGSEATAPVIDRDTALARAGDDPELLGELAELFLEECPRLLSQIRSAITDGDASRLKASAHSLKGSIDNFAAKTAYEAAMRLEMLGRNGNLFGAEAAWVTLQQEMDRLNAALGDLARAPSR